MSDYPSRFTVTEDHIKLLQLMWIRWDDDAYDGAPAVDLKRPYGNSDVIGDVAEALEWDRVKDRYGELVLTEEQAHAAEKIHGEMYIVIQILVQHPLDFTLGEYRKVSLYGNEYEKVPN